MNTPIRRLGVVAAIMFCALLLSSTVIQFVQAKSLNAKPGNARTQLASYSKDRGSILVDGKAVAQSVPSGDIYKFQRTYSNGTLYAPLTGFYSLVYGTAGVERAYNALLAGTSDKLFYRQFIDVITGTPAKGANVELTINPKAQQVAARALGNQRGAVVALDPKTGAILAMVTSPSYDPNLLAGHNAATVQRNWQALLDRNDQPLINRAIGGDLYPPGSTFKLVTAAAALSSGKYNPNSVLPGPRTLKIPGTSNYYLPNYGGEVCGPNNETSLIHALAISCNTAFASLGMDLGADALRQQADKFGFGQAFTVPMQVTPSVFPSGTLNAAQTAQSAIGQFDVRVTPLQVAMISAAIANGGKEMKPYAVQDVRDKNLAVIESTDPSLLSSTMSPDVARTLTTMMEQVVTSGTGVLAQIPGVQVAGKTGTAEHGNGNKADVWFTGFAPANDPKVAVAVVVENGGNIQQEATGGSVAAPIARQVMEAVMGK